MSYNKYQRLVHQVSTDGGRSWTTAVPVQYAKGDLIERNSLDCQPSYRWVVVSGEFICGGTEGYDKYEKLKKQVSLDGGTTWTDTVPLETQAGNLIQRNSVDCGAEPEYKWEVDHSRIVCDGTTAYYALVEYVSYDNRATWTETGNVQKSTVVYQENYPDCIQTVYRWIATGGYVCVGTSKYAEEKQQVSYNSGSTWTDTGSTRAGNLIENNSVDCGATNVEWVNVEGVICETTGYRWITIEGSSVCVGTTKYAVEKEQSTTDGTTWTDTGSTRRGSVIETESADCEQQAYTFDSVECTGLGYDIPTGDNWVTRTSEPPIEGYFELVGNDSYGNYVWRQNAAYDGSEYLYIGVTNSTASIIDNNIICVNKLVTVTSLKLCYLSGKYIDLRGWDEFVPRYSYQHFNITAVTSKYADLNIDYLFVPNWNPEIVFGGSNNIDVKYYEGPLKYGLLGSLHHSYTNTEDIEVTSLSGTATGTVDVSNVILANANSIDTVASSITGLRLSGDSSPYIISLFGNNVLSGLTIADKGDFVGIDIYDGMKLTQSAHDNLISAGLKIRHFTEPDNITTLQMCNVGDTTSTYLHQSYLPVYSRRLTTLILDGAKVTAASSQTGPRAFSRCPNLRTISMIGCDSSSVTVIQNAINASPIKDKATIIT